MKFDNTTLAWRICRIELRETVLRRLEAWAGMIASLPFGGDEVSAANAYMAAALALTGIGPLSQKMPHEIAIKALERIVLIGGYNEATMAKEALDQIAELQ